MLTVNVSADYSVRVKVGDWMKYENTFWMWMMGTVQENITQKVEAKVLSIEGTNVTFALDTQLQNGSETNETFNSDVAIGALASFSN
jgi:hypothetical protein